MHGAPKSLLLERNVRLYPWYATFFNAHFWMPVFVLYFLERMPIESVLRLEAVYYASVVVIEVPSGYFSDRIGRRPTLLIASAFLVTAYTTFFLGGSFAAFAIAQIFLAAGIAFNSGTDTSFHYDSLASLGRQREYEAREAIAARNGLFAAGLAGIAGGAVGLIGLRYAYGLSALAAVVSLILVACAVEPVAHERVLVRDGPLRQIQACGRLLSDPVLRWTFAYVVVMIVLNHVPYEFYQPYIRHALPAPLRQGTPLATGVHVGLVMLIASGAAAWSIAIRNRIGYVRTLLVGAALQVLIIASMGVILHPVMMILILLRSVPRGLAAAPVNAAVAPRVASGRRATFLSLQSLAGRLAFSGFLLALSALSVPAPAPDAWIAISRKLVVAAAFGGVVWTVLCLTRPSGDDVATL